MELPISVRWDTGESLTNKNTGIQESRKIVFNRICIPTESGRDGQHIHFKASKAIVQRPQQGRGVWDGTNPARGSRVQTPQQRHDQVQTSLPPSFLPSRPYHRQYTGRTVTRGTLVKGVNMHAMWCSAERRTAACHEGDSVCVFPPQNRMHLPPALRSCPYMRTPQSKAGRCLYASLHFLPL